MKLYAPEGYTAMDPDKRQALVNGCGTRGFNVPDKFLGLRMTPACNIHDYMYTTGETIEDKKEADRVFLNNMLRIIREKGGWFEKPRMAMAYFYFQMVRIFGGPAFWKDKNEPENEVEV